MFLPVSCGSLYITFSHKKAKIFVFLISALVPVRMIIEAFATSTRRLEHDALYLGVCLGGKEETFRGRLGVSFSETRFWQQESLPHS